MIRLVAKECRQLNGCETGDAKPTGAFDLPARHVIHTVGPIWRGGDAGERDLLAACYRRCLEIARDLDCTTVSFPAISTGAYGYPHGAAAKVAVATVGQSLDRPPEIDTVFLVAIDQRTDRHLLNAMKSAAR